MTYSTARCSTIHLHCRICQLFERVFIHYERYQVKFDECAREGHLADNILASKTYHINSSSIKRVVESRDVFFIEALDDCLPAARRGQDGGNLDTPSSRTDIDSREGIGVTSNNNYTDAIEPDISDTMERYDDSDKNNKIIMEGFGDIGRRKDSKTDDGDK